MRAVQCSLSDSAMLEVAHNIIAQDHKYSDSTTPRLAVSKISQMKHCRFLLCRLSRHARTLRRSRPQPSQAFWFRPQRRVVFLALPPDLGNHRPVLPGPDLGRDGLDLEVRLVAMVVQLTIVAVERVAQLVIVQVMSRREEQGQCTQVVYTWAGYCWGKDSFLRRALVVKAEEPQMQETQVSSPND